MEYIDKVYVHLKDRQPGRYPIHNLREKEKFIEAVKELIDGEWLRDVCFSSDYRTLIVSEPFIPKIKPVDTEREEKANGDD